jgi:trans-2,3-dihydro-3-hydroxyanthranilate isomerase
VRRPHYHLVDVFTAQPFGGNPLAAMRRIRFRTDVWERSLRAYGQVFAFSMETEQATSTVHSRMFAPSMGIAEDPASGVASGPLGCYLVRHGLVRGNPARIVSEQGMEMGRPSLIHIEIGQHDGVMNLVSVGGECVYVGEGSLEIID